MASVGPATVAAVVRKDAVSEEKEEAIALDQFVRHLIALDVKAWIAKHGEARGVDPDIAKRTHVSVPTVHDVRKNKKTAGPKFAAGYADARGQSLKEFRDEAVAWYRAHGEVPVSAPIAEAPPSEPARWVDRDGILADVLIADLIRGGHMDVELRDSVRPRILLSLGHASDGSTPSEAEQMRIALAAVAAAKGAPLAQRPSAGEPLPTDSALRTPRSKVIELKKSRGKQ